jgi:transcription elongation factor Elf1
VNRRGHLDSLSVKVELKESSLTLTHEQRCQVCHQLRHRIKSMVGISTDVTIVNCGSIPRSEAKPAGCLTCVKCGQRLSFLTPALSQRERVSPLGEGYIPESYAMIHPGQK